MLVLLALASASIWLTEVPRYATTVELQLSALRDPARLHASHINGISNVRNGPSNPNLASLASLYQAAYGRMQLHLQVQMFSIRWQSLGDCCMHLAVVVHAYSLLSEHIILVSAVDG